MFLFERSNRFIVAATDPGETAVYDGLLLLNNNTPSPLHLPKHAKKHEQKFIEDANNCQQTRRGRYFGMATNSKEVPNRCFRLTVS